MECSMTNSDPALTGLGPSVTFLENTVNATPLLLDINVTFTDPDNNFNGGTLSIGGLLDEDSIGIRNQGNLPGQIGYSNGVVTYGGIVIGEASLVGITFNAAATSAGIDALLQNLTYLNRSDTPTATHTLTVTVTDAAGHPTTHPGFAYDGATDAIFVGFDNVLTATPELADVNGDGLLDIVACRRYFRICPLFEEHRHGHRAGLCRADRRRQSVRGHLAGDDAEFIRKGVSPQGNYPRSRSAMSAATASSTLSSEMATEHLLLPEHRHCLGAGVRLADRCRQSVRPRLPGANSKPELVDLDSDGDLDVVVGTGLEISTTSKIMGARSHSSRGRTLSASRGARLQRRVRRHRPRWPARPGDQGRRSGWALLSELRAHASAPVFSGEGSGPFFYANAFHGELPGQIAIGSGFSLGDLDGDGDRRRP